LADDVLHVASAAESAAASCKDDDASRLVLLEILEEPKQAFIHGKRERVEAIRPVEGHSGDARFLFQAQTCR
jgi:hypothetical protein